MIFSKPKNLERSITMSFFLSSTLILSLSTQAIGQSLNPPTTKPFLELSKLSDEQWVKGMDGLFNVLRYLCDDDELKVIQAQVGLTDEQMKALKKYQAAYTHTHTAAKHLTTAESHLSVEEREKLAGERYEKALKEQIQQAHEFRKIIGRKDIDLVEWSNESWTVYVSITNELNRRKKNGYPDPDSFSKNMLTKIKGSDFYQNYLSQKKNEFKDSAEFDSFVSHHEKQFQERAVFETCGESIQFAAFENKNLSKKLAAKRARHFQTLLISQ